MPIGKFLKSEYCKALNSHPIWIINGRNEELPYQECFDRWWDKLDRPTKRTIVLIPNFDKDIFFEITGIDITEDRWLMEQIKK